jgi:hypothetical protein
MSNEVPDKSVAGLQSEQKQEEGTSFFSTNTSSKTVTTTAATTSYRNYRINARKSIANEKLFLQKISKMIDNEEWRAMDSFLSSPSQVSAYRSGFEPSKSIRWKKSNDLADEVLGLSSSFRGMSMGGNDLDSMLIVHYACRFNPPRTIIRHLASLYPRGVMLQDKMGRLPLHYASKYGSSFRLIDYLIDKDKTAASIKDSLGKTPLHLLCENYSPTAKLCKGGEKVSPEDNMIESTKALLNASSLEVNIQDNYGKSAIEYCIDSNAPYEAVKCIQKASEQDWKERKRLSDPGDSHREIEEKLIKEHDKKQKALELDRETRRVLDQSQLVPTRTRRKTPESHSKYAKSA